MSDAIKFQSDEGREVLKSIVKKLIPQWPNGLHNFQLDSLPIILDNEDLFAITATGDGKSALFAVPILVHLEISKNPDQYPKFKIPLRKKPVGIVVTPTKGLANNIVKETWDQFKISAYAYTRENIARTRRNGLDINCSISECQYQIICVDPEHLREPEWGVFADSEPFRSNCIFACAEEGHIINEWGQDFRPLFRHIGSFFRGKLLVSQMSIFTMTATMQPGAPYESVCSSLGFSGPKFHLIRRSNECLNTEITVETLSSPLSGRIFPQLIPYLNQRRKTIIHVRTIELGYRVFLYLFKHAPRSYNRHRRIRMYSAIAPDGYNERTIELLINDLQCQIVIATKAFSLGIHAKTLQDSISVGTADTQAESDQCGGRVGQDRSQNARRIILATAAELKKAKKNLQDGSDPSAKSTMDPAKVTYTNPPIETSYLDCVQAKRLLPCDLCRARYNLLESPTLFPAYADESVLPLFHVPPIPAKHKKQKDQLKKNEIKLIRQELIAFEKQVWLDEHLYIPHRNIPRSFYLPSEVFDMVTIDLLKIKSLDILRTKLADIPWMFKYRQTRNLFALIAQLSDTIKKSRPSKSKSHQPEHSTDEMEASDIINVNTSAIIPASLKRPALEGTSNQPRAKRKPVMNLAEAEELYSRPRYNLAVSTNSQNSGNRRSTRIQSKK
ncbi:hypothetical protein K435DRAFT_855312 [Dendrothele bispora CBS 962.96]|uniref:DNA 3'-5' helicase n=1 Tax=Dendrothele bispora (strain CBS 962.96) TaxID=1314807 RepID=A0A4S8MBM2_DENBC|nr:hypothetical protein K435DRAFT_855312 [Dendrothele bispora CBS 962.96]